MKTYIPSLEILSLSAQAQFHYSLIRIILTGNNKRAQEIDWRAWGRLISRAQLFRSNAAALRQERGRGFYFACLGGPGTPKSPHLLRRRAARAVRASRLRVVACLGVGEAEAG